MKKSLLIALISMPLMGISQSLQNVEAVEYDHANGRFLVSNSNSIIAIDQQTQELSYFGNGTASHGMEVMNNTLFAISSNVIKAYDLDTENEVMSLNISGAGFLNGMASDGASRLWLTDFSTKKIIEINVSDLNNPTYETVVSNTTTTPNGIVYDETNDRLIFVNWGGSAPIKTVNLETYAVNTITGTSLGNCDGIDNDNQDKYFVSSWSPLRISKFNSEFTGTPEIIEAPGISAPADICYAREIDTLAIPNSGNATVTFVGFDTAVSVNDIDNNPMAFAVAGNPVSNQTYFSFSCLSNDRVLLTIIDETGKTVATLVDGARSPGYYKILLNGIDLASGIYIAQLQIGQTKAAQKIIVP